MNPQYNLRLSGYIRAGISILLEIKRSFRDDAREAVQHIQPKVRVKGSIHVPSSGSYLITVNHYFRPGFNSWWIPLLVSHQIPAQVRWIMTSELTYPGKKWGLILRPFSRWLLRRIAKVYGFFTMSAMPPHPDQINARAASVRRVLEAVRLNPSIVIGLAPEGRDFQNGCLGLPPPGAGRFILSLTKLGLKILPACVYESSGTAIISFGDLYTLETSDRSRGDIDKKVAKTVMEKIALLIPAQLRGPYTQQMERIK